jgi:hypothetical protein
VSETSEKARAAMKDKAERLVRADPRKPVDASGYTPDGAMDADSQTGMRPISRRQFKRGGKVEGAAAPHRADRKPRASGGSALTADSLINRDVKAANKERGGDQHIGGMKSGGRAHKMVGGPMMQLGGQRAAMQAPAQRPMMRKDGGKTEHKDAAQDKKLIHEMGCKCAKCSGGRVGKKAGGTVSMNPVYGGTRPVAGRLARKGGGRTKGKTNVNIIISQPPAAGPAMPPPGMPPRPMGAPPGAAPPGVGLHQGTPPPMIPAGAMPVPANPQAMPRKSGGRTGDGWGGELAKAGSYPIKDGAGGGLGRLEKTKAYGA